MPRQTRFPSSTADKKFPVLVLLDLAFGFVAPHLLVERVKKLLAGGRAGECGAVVQSSAEAAEVEQAFRRAVERHAHAVEQIDDARRGLAHVFDRRLVAQKISAIDRVVKMLPGRVAFALQILRRVDAALRAHRVRPLHRNNREQVDAAAHLGDLDHRGKSGESAAYDDNFRSCHVIAPPLPDGVRRWCSATGVDDRAFGRAFLQRLRAERSTSWPIPRPHSTRNKARQTRSNRFCALSPETMPHFAENSQMP